MMIYNRMFGGQGADPQMQYLQQLMRLNPNNKNVQEMGVEGIYNILDPQTQMKNRMSGYELAGAERELNSTDDEFGKLMDLAAGYLEVGDSDTAKAILDMAQNTARPQSSGYMGYPGMEMGAGGIGMLRQPQQENQGLALGVNPIGESMRQRYAGMANDFGAQGNAQKYGYYNQIAQLPEDQLIRYGDIISLNDRINAGGLLGLLNPNAWFGDQIRERAAGIRGY